MNEIISKELAQSIESKLGHMFQREEFSFETCFEYLLQGKVGETVSYLFNSMKQATVGELCILKEIGAILLLLGILGSVFAILSDSFENKQVSKMAQSVFMLLAAVLLFGVYQEGNRVCSDFFQTEKEYLQVLLPAFCMTLTITTGTTTGYSYYQLTLLILYFLQLILQYFFLPLIRLYVSFAILNGIGKQKRFEKAGELCEKAIEWGSRAGLYAGIGSYLIQGLLYPKLDGSKRSLVTKGIAMLPGIGEISDQAAQILIASAELTRNCLGIVGGIGLLILVFLPLAKLFLLGVGMKLCASFLEMLGEKRISELTGKMGNVELYFVRLMFCGTVLLLLSFAVIAFSTNHG